MFLALQEYVHLVHHHRLLKHSCEVQISVSETVFLLAHYLYYIPAETRVPTGRERKSLCFQLHLMLASQRDAKCCTNLTFHFKSLEHFSVTTGTRCLWFEWPLGTWKLTANTSDCFPTLPGCPQKKNPSDDVRHRSFSLLFMELHLTSLQNCWNCMPRKYSARKQS